MEFIRLKTKEDFKTAREEYKNSSSACWKMYMWDFFRIRTCYVPEQDIFINLDKAEKFGFTEK